MNPPGNVSVTVSGEGLVGVSDVPVKSLALIYEGGSGRVLAGTLNTITITAPTVCATTSRQPSLMYVSSDSIMLNGKTIGSQDTLACLACKNDDNLTSGN